MLIAMAGLPGSGKSTIAEILAGRLGATVISVDPIEAAILRAGIDSDQPTGLAAYLVAETMAEQVLLSGHSVVVDAVNAVEPARLQWRDLAERCDVKLRVIETVCSDPALHEERLVEADRGSSPPTRSSRASTSTTSGRAPAARCRASRSTPPPRSARTSTRHSTSWRASVLILLPPSETKRDGGAGSPLALDRLAFPVAAPRAPRGGRRRRSSLSADHRGVASGH